MYKCCSNCKTTESSRWVNKKEPICNACYLTIKRRKNGIKPKNPNFNRKEYKKQWAKENLSSIVQRNKLWQIENSEKYREFKLKYNKSPHGRKKKRELLANYRAKLNKSKLKWLNDNQLKEISLIYKNCPDNHEVDHIIPINGKEVCGLHVPWNLQYLTKSENCKKSNKI